MSNEIKFTRITENIEPLLFPGWEAEKVILKIGRKCINCGKILLKDQSVIVVSKIKKVRANGKRCSTYAFCDIGCERQAHVTQRLNRAFRENLRPKIQS